MKMELQLEKEDCTIEINGKKYNGALATTVEVNYTAGSSGSMRCGSSSYEDCSESPSPSDIEVEWAECTLTLCSKDGKREVSVLQFFGVDWFETLFGEIEEEHLDAGGII